MAIEEEEDCDECLSYDGTRTIIPLELPKIIASPVVGGSSCVAGGSSCVDH